MSEMVDDVTTRLCKCPEPIAGGEDYPDNMHTHDGCRVYHKGKICKLKEAQMKLDLEQGKRCTNSSGDEVES